MSRATFAATSSRQQHLPTEPIDDDDDTVYPTPLSLTTQSPYAYAFLIGGCGPESPGYKGFLWGVKVSAEILRSNNSTADVVALIQLAGSSRRLPAEEEQALANMQIRVQYLPPVTMEHSFYDAVLEKLRILQLTEYRRVLFLDADIMPLDTSMDYVFEATDAEAGSSSKNDRNATEAALLKPNVLRATRGEPCNAGFFVLEPGEGKWERLQEIIDRREVSALQQKWARHWDSVTGWGAETHPEGGWKGTHQSQKYGWKFWFAAAGTLLEWS